MRAFLLPEKYCLFTAETLKGVLAQSKISDISLRMFVKQVRVHQNEDRSLELTFELNGSFEDSATAFVGEEENETGILIDYNAPEGFYKQNSFRGATKAVKCLKYTRF